MTRKTTVFVISFLLAAAVLPGLRAAAGPWESRVDPWVLETSRAGETEFMVYLAEQANLDAAAGLTTRNEKGRFVFEALHSTASKTQGPILAQLEALGAEYRSYWIANFIWVRGDAAVVRAMAERTDVAHIFANPWVAMDPAPAFAIEAPGEIEWNIPKVNADDVWAEGVTGDGAVIAGADTGYEWDHPALINQYRGWNGVSADHDYHWHDAIHSGGGSCGPDSPEPCDDYWHGTHTMGTMVGDDFDPDPEDRNQVGMAPGARWIGCRNMDEGVGSPTTYSECFQFFIAPTDLNDQNPDPDLAPHVINNSWGCPPSEGCTDPLILQAVVENTVAAGIVVVSSAGNSGSSCESVDTPTAIYDAAFSVGATNSSDLIAGFSSRGPVTVDGSDRLKPDISAPGVGIRSTFLGGGYATSQGTSMAAPHVAGLVGLLISAVPELSGDVAALEMIIQDTALERIDDTCGGPAPGEVPNNVYGYGRIDAHAAYQQAVANPPTETPTAVVTATSTPSPTATSSETPGPTVEPEFTINLPLIFREP